MKWLKLAEVTRFLQNRIMSWPCDSTPEIFSLHHITMGGNRWLTRQPDTFWLKAAKWTECNSDARQPCYMVHVPWYMALSHFKFEMLNMFHYLSETQVTWSAIKGVIIPSLLFSHSVWLYAIPWTVAHQAPLSMGFLMQEHWSGLPFPSTGDLPNPGIKPMSPALAGGSLTAEPPGKPKYLVS